MTIQERIEYHVREAQIERRLTESCRRYSDQWYKHLSEAGRHIQELKILRMQLESEWY